jgi:hypothetical protein
MPEVKVLTEKRKEKREKNEKKKTDKEVNQSR